ncbi:unnamed protein product [Paramecium sonneborni]|uniref:Uncharacterized protein n=1 Tax=Paramecium sonneborni TaxID=65129 RepID=A0A8S1MSI4_9CILI|nr:unnamed protein product [Paramecium sonneborni]
MRLVKYKRKWKNCKNLSKLNLFKQLWRLRQYPRFNIYTHLGFVINIIIFEKHQQIKLIIYIYKTQITIVLKLTQGIKIQIMKAFFQK